MPNKLDRRSFLRRVGATAGVGALGIITGATALRAQVSDSDTGRNADPVGRGRTGVTDTDSTDAVGRGQASDNDTGRNADGVRARCSDSDSGRNADPAGRGQHC
ncbi:MAG: twin-arginine translocation signal domain-containing protein [Parasphingopyxis sp.]